MRAAYGMRPDARCARVVRPRRAPASFLQSWFRGSVVPQQCRT